jgi:putative tricarboxylic transport membrane protein
VSCPVQRLNPASPARWLAGLVFFLIAFSACAQSAWRPEKPVEIILPTAAGGANDVMARLIQKTLQDHKVVETPVLVMNKAGGNQTLAAVYLRQHPKDPHYLLYSTSTVFTAQITGLTQQHYGDLTPIALLMTEHSVFSVRVDSPIKTMRDFIAQLKTDPQSLAFGIVSRGGSNHIALSQVVKSAGIDPKRLKIVVFKTNVESYLGLGGGHIQAVASSASAAYPFVQQGTARILAIAAPERQSGPLAQVPTLREAGIEIAGVTNWRGVFGAPGLTPAQSAFWEDAFAKIVATEDWKKPLEQSNLGRYFLRGREFSKFLETEYAASKAVLTELGYAKQQP